MTFIRHLLQSVRTRGRFTNKEVESGSGEPANWSRPQEVWWGCAWWVWGPIWCRGCNHLLEDDANVKSEYTVEGASHANFTCPPNNEVKSLGLTSGYGAPEACAQRPLCQTMSKKWWNIIQHKYSCSRLDDDTQAWAMSLAMTCLVIFIYVWLITLEPKTKLYVATSLNFYYGVYWLVAQW